MHSGMSATLYDRNEGRKDVDGSPEWNGWCWLVDLIGYISVSKTRSLVFWDRVRIFPSSIYPLSPFRCPPVHHLFLLNQRGTSQSPLLDYPIDNQEGIKKVTFLEMNRIERCVVDLRCLVLCVSIRWYRVTIPALIPIRIIRVFYLSIFLSIWYEVSMCCFFQVRQTHTFTIHYKSQPQICLFSLGSVFYKTDYPRIYGRPRRRGIRL